MDEIESARGLGVAIFFELPAFNYAAAVGEFDTVEAVFDDDGALLRFAFGGSEWNGGDFWSRRWLRRKVAGWGRRLSGSDRRRDLRLIRLLRRRLRLGCKEFRPDDDDDHREERSDEDAKLRAQAWFFLGVLRSLRIAHSGVPSFMGAMRLVEW